MDAIEIVTITVTTTAEMNDFMVFNTIKNRIDKNIYGHWWKDIKYWFQSGCFSTNYWKMLIKRINQLTFQWALSYWFILRSLDVVSLSGSKITHYYYFHIVETLTDRNANQNIISVQGWNAIVYKKKHF